MTPKQEVRCRQILAAAHRDYGRVLRLYAFSKVHDYALSEDLVQNTFTKTWNYLIGRGKVKVMRAFLYHILNHLIVDEYRKRKTVSIDLLCEKGFEPSVDDSRRLFNVLDAKALVFLIQRLPPVHQKVMRMRYVQDLSLKEISQITGKSKNTIAVQTHRWLEKLRVLYNAQDSATVSGRSC